MIFDQELYQTYLDILKEELIPAMGCTEPIAVAHAGALARKTLGAIPERIELTVSGNIIKNVKSVIGHHTTVVQVRRNGEMIVDKPFVDETVQTPENRKLLNVKNIVAFADEVDTRDVREILQRQMDCNLAIAQDGLEGKYGASIGKDFAEVLRRQRAEPGQGLGRHRVGCPDERLRAAGGHQLWDAV